MATPEPIKCQVMIICRFVLGIGIAILGMAFGVLTHFRRPLHYDVFLEAFSVAGQNQRTILIQYGRRGYVQ